MTDKTISTATAPNGQQFEKVSLKGKHFGYAVIARGDNPTWTLFSFNSSERAAQNKASSEQSWWTREGRTAEYGDFTVVETTVS